MTFILQVMACCTSIFLVPSRSSLSMHREFGLVLLPSLRKACQGSRLIRRCLPSPHASFPASCHLEGTCRLMPFDTTQVILQRSTPKSLALVWFDALITIFFTTETSHGDAVSCLGIRKFYQFSKPTVLFRLFVMIFLLL